MKGTGTITAVNPRQIEVRLDSNNADAEIILMTSMIFGNEVLDATNIISRNQFNKTNDYNAISTEVNRIVEIQIAEPFRKLAKTGETIVISGRWVPPRKGSLRMITSPGANDSTTCSALATEAGILPRCTGI